MKISSNIKKYDLITLEVTKGVIKNCLVQAVHKSGGITVYPIEKYIEDAEHPRAVAKIFIPNENIVKTTKENLNLLFYTVNTKHSFLREALEYHMKNESESRQN
jgi:hypothetical protein